MFKVGDKISVLDKDFTGIVKEVLSVSKVKVEDEFGFNYEFSVHDLVLNDASKYDKVEVNQYKKTDVAEKRKAKKRQAHIPIVDLHMENLTNSHSHMSNHEIVMFQLNHFKNKLEVYKNRGIREFVVVHGIGSGKLKAEVRYILNGYSKIEYMDDHISGYGVGATRIFLH